jgi:hypothetical protein
VPAGKSFKYYYGRGKHNKKLFAETQLVAQQIWRLNKSFIAVKQISPQKRTIKEVFYYIGTNLRIMEFVEYE